MSFAICLSNHRITNDAPNAPSPRGDSALHGAPGNTQPLAHKLGEWIKDYRIAFGQLAAFTNLNQAVGPSRAT